jgi:hypothetical protein
MARVRLKKMLGEIAHPNLPELQFTSERPNAADVLEYRETVKAMDRYQVATHPITGEILRDATGQPERFKKEPILDFTVVTDFLVKHVKVVKGLFDENDRPIDYGYQTDRDEKIKVLRLLAENDFMVKGDRPANPKLCDKCGEIKHSHGIRIVDHEFEPETTRQLTFESCLHWLTKEVCSEKNYRPLVSTSSTPPLSDPSEGPPSSAETVS